MAIFRTLYLAGAVSCGLSDWVIKLPGCDSEETATPPSLRPSEVFKRAFVFQQLSVSIGECAEFLLKIKA